MALLCARIEGWETMTPETEQKASWCGLNGVTFLWQKCVFQTTWVKKANMKLHWPDREGNWYDCLLEMEQGISYEMDGTLTIQFKFKHKMKVIHTLSFCYTYFDVICTFG